MSRESGNTNVNRLAYGAFVAMAGNIVSIIIFMTSKQENGTDVLWRSGVIISHCVMFALMSVSFITALILRRREKQGLPARILQYFACCIILAAGVSIVSFHQLVTTNITPYIMVCIIMGAVILIRPLYSGIIYLASYAVYFFCIALAPNTPEAIISNRANGFGAIAIGFVISVVMWRNNIIKVRQNKRIEQQQEELEMLAYSDPLTGLPNRGHFDEVIKKEVSLSDNGKRMSCLIMLDIDFFKDVNDRFGHPSGDMVLVQVGDLLLKHIRKSDFICRLGGEEFILLLPDTSPGEAETVAEKLRSIIETTQFNAGGKPVRITASFGVSALDLSLDPTLVHQYSSADSALYQAKQNGRNRVVAV